MIGIEEIFYKFFGTPSERRLKRLQPYVDRIAELETEMEALPPEAFPEKTQEFKQRLAHSLSSLDADIDKAERQKVVNAALWELLPEAFALVREAAKRTIGLRHYDVQLLGGMVIHDGGNVEMRTGEGKTLVATCPVYLNALTGRGVHLVTVNDYLAERDRDWMKPVYEYCGMTVGFVHHDMDGADRRLNYGYDITYVTNNEIGFDYLRDNMARSPGERVLRPVHFAIVDEVDSILIDEARTPLIISGPTEEKTDRYVTINKIIPQLKVRKITEEDEVQAKYSGEDLGLGYDATIDEKNHTAVLTDQGIAKAEKMLNLENLYDDLDGQWVHHITQALRAHHLYRRDVDYVVKEGEIIIVDEFTGRLMPGRRWSEGLHQAVEAKEYIPPREENQTLATITFQNFFKMYDKLAGMTGTAMTEAAEFMEIYKLDVVDIPTNRPNVRIDQPDVVYLNQRGKWRAIVSDIEASWKQARPMLVGTRSIEKSEKLSMMLREKGIPHRVLNAKYHEQEAEIIAQAGSKGTVTIATNMAGRGTDIVLGGSPPDAANQKAVIEAGGLYVICTERHEARRIDNQLRGRCARQGDPGETRFYLALDDELMRMFGSERIMGMMEKFGMTEDEPIESPLVSRQIEGAQRRVETHNFDIRKQLLEFDNVMNKQREVIYGLRNYALDTEDISQRVHQMMDDDLEDRLAVWAPKGAYQEKWDMVALSAFLKRVYGIEYALTQDELFKYDQESLHKEVQEKIRAAYEKRQSGEFEGYDFKEIERMVLLQVIDKAWKNHLYDLDHMRKYIHLRAYGQKDPKREYQKESFELFQVMLDHIRQQTIEFLFRIQAPRQPVPLARVRAVKPEPGAADSADASAAPAAQSKLLKSSSSEAAPVATVKKIGRNSSCPCGSGKKYKKCCGK
ncbi:MAG: preprotein translocase subunit SecA [Elusimicrobiota bacterium]